MNFEENEILFGNIKKLPQVLQDNINLYNVEHRQLMKQVHTKLLFYYKEIKCHNCHNILKRINPETISIGINYEYFYCSMDCLFDDKWI
jgi:hypothetical protein